MENNILSRTKEALDDSLIEKIKITKFCIVGCGAVGATFAEMLVRTGAENLTLIDGDKVEITNLNRVVTFLKSDIGKNKVDVLENRLKAINPSICVKKSSYHLKELDPDSSDDTKNTRNLIVPSEVVVNVPDTNRARTICQKLCDDVGRYTIKTLSVGVRIEKDFSDFECVWNPGPLSKDKIDNEGYGSGSYMAIVTEATSVGFMMLLHHLKNPESKDFPSYYKKYKNYIPLYSQ